MTEAALSLRRLLRWAGVDRAVGYTLLGTGWSALSGLMTLVLLTRFLSPVQQGFYYEFNSLLGAVNLLELGMAYLIMQFASHERARLEWTRHGTLEGDARAKARLASLLRIGLVWYGVVALLVMLLLFPCGLIYLSHQQGAGAVAWQTPWLWLALATVLRLLLTPLFFLLEGCGLIAEIVQFQTIQNVLGTLLLWAVFWRHGGLLAAPASLSLVIVLGAVWLWRRQTGFLQDLLRRSGSRGVRSENPEDGEEPEVAGLGWRQEVWPLQWKLALSGLAGFLISQPFTLLLGLVRGPVAAGQMGLSLTIMGSIAGISIGWLTTKSATFGTLIARRDFAGLDGLFFPSLWRSLGLVVTVGFLFWLADWGVQFYHLPLGRRLLPPLPLGLLIGTAVINHVVSAEAIYLRAHKQEPFLVLSLLIGFLISGSCLLTVRPYGATGMMLSSFLVTLFVAAGGGTWLFVQKRQQWHGAPAKAAP